VRDDDDCLSMMMSENDVDACLHRTALHFVWDTRSGWTSKMDRMYVCMKKLEIRWMMDGWV
jgi:hypothetical protein